MSDNRYGQKITVEMNGKTRRLNSKFEYRYCLYLDWQKNKGYIQDWDYETKQYKFDAYFEDHAISKPLVYTPDWLVTDNDGSVVWHETKGEVTAGVYKKFLRMMHCFPDIIFELILEKPPGKRQKEQWKRIAKIEPLANVRNVQLYANIEIFRPLECIIDFRLPIVRQC